MNHTPIPEKTFTTILKSMPICTVDVLFLNKKKDKILLLKRKNEPLKDVFFSMGGRLLKNEKILNCAKRQTQREIGLSLRNTDLYYGGVQEEIHKNSAFKNVSYHAISIFYFTLVDENTFHPKLDKQHSDGRWFDIKDKEIHPFIKQRLSLIF
ncbi:MAG: NUDIX domain-containing protein [Candidatus Vogelbacteria bacterium]|nr:NUDIX domain-containing protein [Candidatus Vogelbacteria bacterium]